MTQSMQRVSRLTSSGSTLGNMPTRSWLRPSLRYGSVSTTPLARSVGGDRRARRRPRSRWSRRPASGSAGSRDERRRVRRLPRPRRRSGWPSRRSGRRRTSVRPGRSATRSWSRSRNSVAIAGVLRVWFRRELSIAVVQAEAVGDPAAGGGDPGDPLERGRGQDRQPQAAVGAEALLRREVVDVGGRDVDRGPAGRGGAVDDDQRVRVGARRSAGPGRWRRSRSRCAPRRRRRRRRPRWAARPSRRSAVTTLGLVEVGGGGRRRGELGRELPEAGVGAAAARSARTTASVPEQGRAAVAQHDLVPVRAARRARPALPGRRRPDS